MNLLKWAENEVRLAQARERKACSESSDDYMYGGTCYQSALNAYKSLVEDGHSGYSFSITRNILNRLMYELPLTPIEDTDDIWSDIVDVSGLKGEKENYQCKRHSALFKYVYSDGTVKYKDINRVVGVNINNPSWTFTTGLITEIYDEMFPITMPYMPELPAQMLTEDFLYDPKNGDFDTMGLFKIIKHNGETIEVNRYFKEGEDCPWVEITEQEYFERKMNKYNKDDDNEQEKI